MSPKTARMPITTVAVAIAALALTGCTSTSGGGTDSEASSELDTLRPGVLTVCTNDAPPNIVINEEGGFDGVEIDIANAMAEELNLEVDFLEYAFAGLIPALQAGQCDVIMGSLYIRPEREEIADFVPYLLSGSAVGVTSANPAGVTGYDSSLCGIRAVAITGATGATLAEEQSATCESDGDAPIDITLVDENVNALQQVQTGQADAVLDTAPLLAYYQQQSDDEFILVGEPFGTIEIGAATLRGSGSLHEALMGAFNALTESGTYDQILSENGAEIQDVRTTE